MVKSADPKAGFLNERISQQARHAPIVPETAEGPEWRAGEGYAADYHELSERLADASRAQAETLAQVEALKKELVAKDAALRRVKAQRLKDLERLAAVSRTRDLLEKRSSAQMAKVAAAFARNDQPDKMAAPVQQVVQPTAQLLSDPSVQSPEPILATDLAEQTDRRLGWADHRRWAATVKVARLAHKQRRLAEATAAFEVALRAKQTASLWEEYGHVLREKGAFKAAEMSYSRALVMQPGKAEIMFLSGYCLEMVGRTADAVTRYEDALAADPALITRYDHLRDFRARLVP